MAGIRTDGVPKSIDGPSLVAAASGLMLLPENASRLLRLHRLAALGMALHGHDAASASPSAVRSLLKREDIGGNSVLVQEDPYPGVLVQSISFYGGPYLVSSGTGEQSVSDLENLLDAVFREPGLPKDLLGPARLLAQGLLTVSDMVLRKAGLRRGTAPSGSLHCPVAVPGAARLRELSGATFVSNNELDAHGDWLRTVIDTFALDPGQLEDPCANDITDDRLYTTPFQRLPDGYRVVLPVDLAITIRFHLLRFALQEGQLDELGKRWRESVFRRFQRLLPPGVSPTELEFGNMMSRYLVRIDDKRDLHVVVATDPLVDWHLEVWGTYDTQRSLERLAKLISPGESSTYSSAEELLHLVIVDSPGREAFWGVPNIDSSGPVLIARADDLEVILHQEPDGLLGLFLFAQAMSRRPGRSWSAGVLDEYCSYVDHDKSFYLSDGLLPTGIFFQPGDGLYSRLKYHEETDRHGVLPPIPNAPIVQARRRYEKDAPEIFVIEPTSSYPGYVVELGDQTVFITMERYDAEFLDVEFNLFDCVSYWVRECAMRTGAQVTAQTGEIVLRLSDPESWRRVGDWSTVEPAVHVTSENNRHILEFTESFLALLQESTNSAERELVAVLLACLFGVTDLDVGPTIDAVAPSGWKRMLHATNENSSPDMLAGGLPSPLTGHGQIMAQLLDELGEWLRKPDGGGFSTGVLPGEQRVRALNEAVSYLFGRLETKVAPFGQRALLDFLVAQNEALVHDARVNETMLRSRLACFGEQSDTVTKLVESRKNTATAQRANRFLIEYVAAQPPDGAGLADALDYYWVLSIATEIIEIATVSDFLHYHLADFEVSILDSGRLGLSREEPVTLAIDSYAANSGMRSVQDAQRDDADNDQDGFDIASFMEASEPAMLAEFGFTLHQLRETCGGLLDLATADRVTHIDRSLAVAKIAAERDMPNNTVSAVLEGITLIARSSFLGIGQDSFPWRFGRNMSYVRRPVVLQGEELVFGFRSIRNLGPYWVDSILSGRLQSRAKTTEMQRCISEARGRINNAFARSVATKLQRFGMPTRVSVNKIGKSRIVDPAGNDIGDIDILAIHPATRSIIAIEAKDFEIARTPSEMANELEKLFSGGKGKKSTVELHDRRLCWLRQHLDELLQWLAIDGDPTKWRVIGAIVTSHPLVTPLLSSTSLPVIPLDDLGLKPLGLTIGNGKRSSSRRPHKRR